MMSIFLFLAAFLSFGSPGADPSAHQGAAYSTDSASVSPQACEYIPKARTQGLMSALPVEGIGFVDCFQKYPETHSIIVAKFSQLDEKTLIDYVARVGRKLDLTSRKSFIGWQSRQPLSSRQLILDTITPAQEQRPEETMAHYAFVAQAPGGGYLVFIHSASASQTHRIRQTLMTLNHQIDSRSFLRRI